MKPYNIPHHHHQNPLLHSSSSITYPPQPLPAETIISPPPPSSSMLHHQPYEPNYPHPQQHQQLQNNNYGYSNNDKQHINTLFVSGLPDDVKAREIHNLFRRRHGFDSCQLKYTGRGNQVDVHHSMPLLKDLTIFRCNKLKAIIVDHGGSLSKLESLELGGCASLYELPPFPNLKSLELLGGPIHPSLLPEAFGSITLQALEVLTIDYSKWTCVPEQVQQLTSLKLLQLYKCGDELKQGCRKDEGEDWRIISHIPNILID